MTEHSVADTPSPPPSPGGRGSNAVARFNRLAKIFGLVFLFVTIGGKVVWYDYRGLPQTQDYPQYYMGALMARLGEWESLYPIPLPDSNTNPGFVGNSELRPKYRELAIETGVGEFSVRYMQPPPLTLLLLPLGFLPFKISFYLWVVLCIFAAWGIGLQAARMYQMSRGGIETRAIGWIVILVCVSPQAHRWVRCANMSVLIGWLIGYMTLELVRRDGFRGAAAGVVGAVAKYATLVLGPMYIVMRRWKTIAWGILMLVLIIGISIFVMPMDDTGPYDVFFTQISPTLARTSAIGENQAIYPTLLRMLKLDAPPLPRALEVGFSVTRIVSILALLAILFLKRRDYWNVPSHVFAGSLALVSWLLLFSPICWEHYHAYLAPFWGWLIYEGTRSRPKLIFAILAIAMSYCPTSLLFQQLTNQRFRLPEPFFSHLLLAALIMFAMAVWALARNETADARR